VFGSAFLSAIPVKLFDKFFELATGAAPLVLSKIF
jgi:hypothetical protein